MQSAFAIRLSDGLRSSRSSQAFPPKPFPKVPAKLLRNFAPRGPLYTIAATIADVRRARDLKKFDLLAPEFRRQVRGRIITLQEWQSHQTLSAALVVACAKVQMST